MLSLVFDSIEIRRLSSANLLALCQVPTPLGYIHNIAKIASIVEVLPCSVRPMYGFFKRLKIHFHKSVILCP